jgi:hypothetical protein
MSKATKFVLNTFIKLTSMTYPYGYEEVLVKELIKCGLFPTNISKDTHGNYFIQVGESRTIFASHLDTVSKTHTKVNHVFEGNMIKTDGTTTLGADDKAGVTTMLWMIKHNVPGLYYFFIGEEVGCIGSGNAARSVADFKDKYDRIISFDRRDVGSVITHQSWSRCCSDAFGDALASELNKSGLSYKKDDGGVYTDSAEFVDIIPECTNISVGYYKEHTTNESQDIDHLTKLAEACLRVDWENLPTERDPSFTEYKTSSYGSSYGSKNTWVGKGSSGIDYGYGNNRGKRKSKKSGRNGYHDDWYDDDYSTYKSDYWGTHGDYPGWDDDVEDDVDSDWDKWEEIETNTGKTYYDKGGELVELKDKKVTTAQSDYEWIMSKFVGSKLTRQDLEVIKYQYLDLSNYNDKLFYDYLVEYVSEQNQ